jgi:hypothetical protein
VVSNFRSLLGKFFGIHCKKGLSIFLSPAGVSLTKLSMAGNNYSGQGEFGKCDIPAVDGKTANLFLQCMFSPFSFIRGLSWPPYVQVSFSLKWRKLSITEFHCKLLSVSCGDIGFKKKVKIKY